MPVVEVQELEVKKHERAGGFGIGTTYAAQVRVQIKIEDSQNCGNSVMPYVGVRFY